jgi:hypothetical protein
VGLVSLLGMAACTGKSPSTSTADTGAPSVDSADTGTATDDTCPPDIVPLAISACAESTIAPSPDDEYSGTALLTEAGPALEAVPDSVALHGFDACDGTFPHQVRLVDDYGDIWTFGWEIEGDLDEESTQTLLPGTDLGFAVKARVDGKSGNALALLLADAVGPVLLYESHPLLSEEQRGMSVDLDYTVSCMEGSREHFGVTYAWAEGSVTLQSGQTATVPLPGRELFLLQGSAHEQTDCTDGCSSIEAMGWAEPP